MPRLACPSCGTACSVPESLLGREVRCAACKRVFGAVLTEQVAADRNESACPFCGEAVLAVAKKCKHCGETIDVALRAAEEAMRAAQSHGQPQVFMNAGGGGGGASSAASSAAAASALDFDDYPVRPRYTPPFPHGLYIFLTVLTGGLGLSFWLLHCLVDSRPSGVAKTVVGTLFLCYWGAVALAMLLLCLIVTAAQH